MYPRLGTNPYAPYQSGAGASLNAKPDSDPPASVSIPGLPSGAAVLGVPVTYLVGLIVLLFGFKLFAEHSDDINPEDIRIGGYNLLAVTVTAITGITLFKVIFAKFRVPGLSDLILAV